MSPFSGFGVPLESLFVALRHTVGPRDPEHVRLQPIAQAKVHHRLVHRAHLVQVLGAQLEPRSDAEAVVFAAALAERDESDVGELIDVAAVVA